MLVARIISKVKVLTQELPTMSYGIFNKKFPMQVSNFLNLFFKSSIFILPNPVISLIPRRWRFLILTAMDQLGISEKRIQGYIKYSFHYKSLGHIHNFIATREYFQHGKVPALDSLFAELELESFENQNKKLKELSHWSFWTLNHHDFNSVNKRIQTYLSSLHCDSNQESRRYLPQHTTNLGHLAMLHLYIKYYGINDRSRIIVLPKIKSANDFLLQVIERTSPLQIDFETIDAFKRRNPAEIDTLHYSRKSDGTYRTESDCSFVPNYEGEEFKIREASHLRLTDLEQERGFRILRSAVKSNSKWFVVLHVREPKNGDLRFSQARDANIVTYEKFAENIYKAGGLVVRMGDSNFPKLKSSFKAFDYAHSQIRSEFMDVWFWSNMSAWIGNVNGAAFIPIAFGKPRFITNQWYWNSVGPGSDYVLKKRLYSRNQKTQLFEIDSENRILRCMNRNDLFKAGFELEENSKDELATLAEIVLQEVTRKDIQTTNLQSRMRDL